MKIAIIGSGIAGLSAAYLLDKQHEVTVFEAAATVGGHVHTVPVVEDGKTIWIDTGFIVCNPKNYPNFFKLMQQLNVPLQKSDMSFSVNVPHEKLEYNGTSLNGLFAQRKNLFKIKFLRMLQDIAKFNNYAKQYALRNENKLTLAVMIKSLFLSQYFTDYYLTPMVGAIWSNDALDVLDMPALFVCKFLNNHGMLNINDRPQWHCVAGGSYVYVNALLTKLKQPVKTNATVTNIIRNGNSLGIQCNGSIQQFDKVIIATHSDQALKLLAAPNAEEIQVLSGLRYQANEVVLHTDISLLPSNKRAWASWNYKLLERSSSRVSVTYNMNMLQNLKCKKTYCVSLNQTSQIDPTKIIAKFNYSHPIYDQPAIASQQRHSTISGVDNIYYCGAYWGSGFHEDGLDSGIRVVKQIDKDNACAAQFSVAG